MKHPAQLRTFSIGTETVDLFVPDPDSLATAYNKEKKAATFYYWAKVWPAALGLCKFLQERLSYIIQKNVLELAAGPGLPAIFSSAYAKQVCISDVEPAAVELVQQTVHHHQLKNVTCQIIDWSDLSTISIPDIVLLSDINYDPSQFKFLLQAIHFLLDQQCTILLCTPQRLMAKDFILQLLPYCIEQADVTIELDGVYTTVTVFVLKTDHPTEF